MFHGEFLTSPGMAAAAFIDSWLLVQHMEMVVSMLPDGTLKLTFCMLVQARLSEYLQRYIHSEISLHMASACIHVHPCAHGVMKMSNNEA